MNIPERFDLFADIVRELVPGFVHQGVVVKIVKFCHCDQAGIMIASTPSQWYNQDTMHIDEFIWLPDIVEKLAAKHQVAPEEVEEVFFCHPRFRFHEKGRMRGEDMYTVLGQNEAGRYLIVFFIFKPTNRALIISARNMKRSERRYYERRK